MGGVRAVWGKPELVVLARNRPEETVLAACKTAEAGGGGEGARNNGCAYSYSTACYGCAGLAGS